MQRETVNLADVRLRSRLASVAEAVNSTTAAFDQLDSVLPAVSDACGVGTISMTAATPGAAVAHGLTGDLTMVWVHAMQLLSGLIDNPAWGRHIHRFATRLPVFELPDGLSAPVLDGSSALLCGAAHGPLVDAADGAWPCPDCVHVLDRFAEELTASVRAAAASMAAEVPLVD